MQQQLRLVVAGGYARCLEIQCWQWLWGSAPSTQPGSRLAGCSLPPQGTAVWSVLLVFFSKTF
jgi:hypothetical protein